MFSPVPGSPSLPKLEEEVLAFWREAGIYEKSLAARAGAEPFVFYEGPPTANGMPHPGHCLTRTIKDVFPRYKTMRGYRCERKAGWDTHGLPVEVEVCKELGIHSKEEIEAYGVEPFIQKCQASVWRYMREWEQLTERLGFWVNLDDAYVTYHQSYVESVWWSLKNLFDRGLLYQGHKIVWWWAQGGTALSSGEVGQGYREVDDPSVYVKFMLADDPNTSLLAWTTTPWTLPSNQFAAVNPGIDYALVELTSENRQDAKTLPPGKGERLWMAKDLVDVVLEKSKRTAEVVEVRRGAGLVGLRYFPPFECYFDKDRADEWKVVSADFVTTDSGTGIVHQAPAFGEVDYEVLVAQREATGKSIPLINCVGSDGKFTNEAPEFVRGRWVKDCDRDLARSLRDRFLLFHQEQYRHDYPFCWRAEQDPLIQYPRESWFIKTTAFKDAMLANNQAINWLPEHIKGGRMGKFLESNVDWALSRERYWGTPLPIWECEETGKQEAIGGYDELLAKPGVQGTEVWEQAKATNPELPDDLRVHKPYIDAVTYDSPFVANSDGGARMRRVTEVIDCWYDSGAMPFAQWGVGGMRNSEGGMRDDEAAKRFAEQFPADFISEALDQTRGWFYSQLAISTMLFGEGRGTREEGRGTDASPRPPAPVPHPFKNCIVLGLMLGEDGQKMSKSKRNYKAPNEIFDTYGADALRWYLLANQPPWSSIRYSEQAIKDSIPEFLLRLWNCYRFLVEYARTDGWEPAKSRVVPEPGARDELDRWVLSELHRTTATVTERMDAYDNFGACAAITEFVDGLSNWWVRRSRDRFWSPDKRATEKLDAYATLYDCLVTTSKLIAPFTPFLAETFWQNLAAGDGDAPESVHLCDYPAADASLVDQDLSERMAAVRLISSLGRRAREGASLKVRQPLSKVEVILADTTHQAWLEAHASVIADELNVKAVEYTDEPERYVDHQVLPNFKLLGKKLGRLMPKVKQALGQASGSELLAGIRDNGKIDLEIDGQPVELSPEEVEVRITAKPGYAAANDRGVVVVLATQLTPELIAEGLARDLVRAIQDRRKEMGLEFTDRIIVGVETDSAELLSAIKTHEAYLAGETLADKVAAGPIGGAEPVDIKLGDNAAVLFVSVVGG